MSPVMKLSSLVLLLMANACADQDPDEAVKHHPAKSNTATEISTDQNTLAPYAGLAAIEEALNAEVDADIRSGFVVMVAHKGDIVYHKAIGLADRENNIPMTENTRFRIASMTKPITTVALMMLVEEEKIGLDDPVSTYIPGFAKTVVATSYNANSGGVLPTEPLSKPITIRHLLTHTGGLGYLFDPETDLGKIYFNNSLYAREGDLAERIDFLTTLPLYSQPGSKWIYSYATDVVGRLIEIVSGDALEAFMDERIFTPLAMKDTKFFVDKTDLDGVAVVYAHTENGDMVRYEGDGLNISPNTDGAGWASGGGGLISTASDYHKFCQMLLNDGKANGSPLLKPETIALMFESHVPVEARPPDWEEQGISFGLGGWVSLADPKNPDNDATTGHFGWGGYYDTTFLISKSDSLAYVVLAQREQNQYAKPSKADDIVREITLGMLAK